MMTTLFPLILFWTLALALTLAVLGALAWPLYRTRAHAVLTLGLAIALPAGALAGYLAVGHPGAIAQLAEIAAEERAVHRGIEESLRIQRDHLDAHPEDALAWLMLGLTLGGLDRWPEAATALARAYALQPEDAVILSAYAEALAVQAGRDLSGRPIALVREALMRSPQDEKALELAAVHAMQTQEYGKAAYYFRQLLRVLPPDSPYANDIRAALREARQRSEAALRG